MFALDEDVALQTKALTTFVLMNRSDSDWILKQDVGLQNPRRLNAPKTVNLAMKSVYCFGEREGYADTMYIEGAPTIFINDVYVDKKGNFHPASNHQKAKAEGWELQKGLRNLYSLDEKGLKDKLYAATKKHIHFAFGVLSLDIYGGDPTLLRFVNCHECNVNAPNAKFNTRGANQMWKFTYLQEEKKAAKKLDTLDVQLEALMYIVSLRTKVKGGYEYTPQNVDKINATLRILDMKHGFQADDYNQKHLAIKNIADANPVEFMQLISDEYSRLRAEIVKGIELKVIDLPKKEEKTIVLIQGEKDGVKTKRNLLDTDKSVADVEGRVLDLSVYFLTDKGTTDYRDFVMICEAARNK